MAEYRHPEVLVSTDWVAAHAGDPKVRVVEVDVDTTAYDKGHLENAVGWNWTWQLQDILRRDLLNRRQMEELLSHSGIAPDTTVVLYGDNCNRFAAYAFWQLKYYRHSDARLMNGGRRKWEVENRPFTREVPSFERAEYKAKGPDESLRARRDRIFRVLEARNVNLVDVRTPDEFAGRVIAPPGMTETAQRGGHIPGAFNLPSEKAANLDGTFRSYDELAQLYRAVKPNRETITYCRIGERSSHSWFVLKYLLGLDKVRNYDGSWTEWGNLVNAPIVMGGC